MKKKILCVIPARSGSKGIKNKNMVYLKGKPLIYWTIKVAKKIRYFDKIVVSTNSKKIKKFSEKNKVEVPYLRSEKLASDKTPMDDVIRDILKYYKNFNYLPYAVVILQPTSPFRQLSTINNACKIFIKKKLDSLISIEEIKQAKIKLSNESINLLIERASGVTGSGAVCRCGTATGGSVRTAA